jgi:ketosteroid isomerase-like protein
MGAAQQAAERYVEAVCAEDMEALLALFQAGAVVRNQLGTFEGLDAIRGFYADVAFAGKARPVIVRCHEEGDVAMVELEATSPLGDPEHKAYAVDVFHVDEAGLVTRLDIYFG